jgi:hypothetical protein
MVPPGERITVTCLRLEQGLEIVRLSQTRCDRNTRSIRDIASPMFYVARVRRLFPDWAVEVSRLALRSPMFRTLCEDYGIAVEALHYLQMHNRPQDVEKLHEYRSVIQDLEKELKYELLAARSHEDPPR